MRVLGVFGEARNATFLKSQRSSNRPATSSMAERGVAWSARQACRTTSRRPSALQLKEIYDSESFQSQMQDRGFGLLYRDGPAMLEFMKQHETTMATVLASSRRRKIVWLGGNETKRHPTGHFRHPRRGCVLRRKVSLPPVRHIDFGPGFLPSIVASGMMLCGLLTCVARCPCESPAGVQRRVHQWRQSAVGVPHASQCRDRDGALPRCGECSGLHGGHRTVPACPPEGRTGSLADGDDGRRAGRVLSQIVFVELLRGTAAVGSAHALLFLLSLR